MTRLGLQPDRIEIGRAEVAELPRLQEIERLAAEIFSLALLSYFDGHAHLEPLSASAFGPGLRGRRENESREGFDLDRRLIMSRTLADIS